eukprot:205663-Chlamydomonas_euryale.AAC.7
MAVAWGQHGRHSMRTRVSMASQHEDSMAAQYGYSKGSVGSVGAAGASSLAQQGESAAVHAWGRRCSDRRGLSNGGGSTCIRPGSVAGTAEIWVAVVPRALCTKCTFGSSAHASTCQHDSNMQRRMRRWCCKHAGPCKHRGRGGGGLTGGGVTFDDTGGGGSRDCCSNAHRSAATCMFMHVHTS